MSRRCVALVAGMSKLRMIISGATGRGGADGKAA
jgi:hypothetical protein